MFSYPKDVFWILAALKPFCGGNSLTSLSDNYNFKDNPRFRFLFWEGGFPVVFTEPFDQPQEDFYAGAFVLGPNIGRGRVARAGPAGRLPGPALAFARGGRRRASGGSNEILPSGAVGSAPFFPTCFWASKKQPGKPKTGHESEAGPDQPFKPRPHTSSIGVSLFGGFARKIDGDSCFTWWLISYQGYPSISPKRTPTHSSLGALWLKIRHAGLRGGGGG